MSPSSSRAERPTVKRNRPPESRPRLIREPAFAGRFQQACDNHLMVPAKHNGRLTWIRRELIERFQEDVSVETIRKWFAGEVKPRPEKLSKLAQLLEVDVAWLSLGVDSDLQPRERRVRNAMAEGVVNVVAGLIQMDGSSPAFPEGGDKNVDLHAIIKGAKYDIHASLGKLSGRSMRFSVPTKYQDLLVLGVIRRGFSLEIVELPAEVIKTGRRHGGSIEVTIDAEKHSLKRIESFAERF